MKQAKVILKDTIANVYRMLVIIAVLAVSVPVFAQIKEGEVIKPAAENTTHAPEANTPEQIVMPRENYLLLDQRLVEKVDNARLTVGQVKKHPANPLFGQELPWEVQISHMYPNVIFDKEEQIYKIWYYSLIRYTSRDGVRTRDISGDITPPVECNLGAGLLATLYATSRDGIRWEKPQLDIFRYKGKPTNIVAWPEHGTGVFKDLHDNDPNRRYKLITAIGGIQASFSPDGIHWTPHREIARASGDTHNNALWAPTLNKYVAFTRQNFGTFRTLRRLESEDFLNWSKPVEVLRGSNENQTYSMPVFYYDGVYLGLLAIYRVGSDRKVQTELAWSPDTKIWHRIDEGSQLIPLSQEPNSYEGGCIYAAATPVVLDDEIRIYYSGQEKKHSWQPGFLCLATLRKDGWAGYEPDNITKPATVQTTPVTCSGKKLYLTADAEGGEVSVEIRDTNGKVLAQSKPLTGNVTRSAVQWPDDFDIATLADKPACLLFKLRGAKIYSFAFGD